MTDDLVGSITGQTLESVVEAGDPGLWVPNDDRRVGVTEQVVQVITRLAQRLLGALALGSFGLQGLVGMAQFDHLCFQFVFRGGQFALGPLENREHVPQGNGVGGQPQEVPQPPFGLPDLGKREQQAGQAEEQAQAGKHKIITGFICPMSQAETHRRRQKEEPSEEIDDFGIGGELALDDHHGEHRPEGDRHTAENYGGDRHHPRQRPDPTGAGETFRQPDEGEQKPAGQSGCAAQPHKAVARQH